MILYTEIWLHFDSIIGMKIAIEPGKYIVAVSGGVDSMVLLDVLVKHGVGKKLQLVVAHFDHDIRPDSADSHLQIS